MKAVDVKLSSETVREIETLLGQGYKVEVAVLRDRLVVWTVQSKKKIEIPVT